MEPFYKKKVIRDFLNMYSQDKWLRLSILCMEYGILSLKEKYRINTLSLEDLEEIVCNLIEEKMVQEKSEQKELYNNKHFEKPNLKPSSDWRKGEKVPFERVEQIDKYSEGISRNKEEGKINEQQKMIEENERKEEEEKRIIEERKILEDNSKISIDRKFGDNIDNSNNKGKITNNFENYNNRNKMYNFQKQRLKPSSDWRKKGEEKTIFDGNDKEEGQEENSMEQYKDYNYYNDQEFEQGQRYDDFFRNNPNSKYYNEYYNDNFKPPKRNLKNKSEKENIFYPYNDDYNLMRGIQNFDNNIKTKLNGPDQFYHREQLGIRGDTSFNDRFKSGLQKLKLNTPLQGRNDY